MQTERVIVPEIQIGKNGSIYSGPPGPLIAGAVGLLVASAVLLFLLFRKRKRD